MPTMQNRKSDFSPVLLLTCSTALFFDSEREMKIMGLSCSPRRNSNTELLLDEFLRACGDADCEVEKFSLASLSLGPCRHCDYCLRSDNCQIDDDMRLLYPGLAKADCLVFAAPMYFMAHCAQAKMVIDRCQVFWARRYIHKLPLKDPAAPPRRGVFISVGATHGSKVFAGARVTMKWFFDALEMEYWDNLLFEGIDEPGAIRQHPTAMREAHELGSKLIRSYGTE